jgi:spore coat polysaccharide biosynthesis protein SpsF
MDGLGIVLQARLGSTRLPGKVLKEIAGRPMLGWILERLEQFEGTADLVVACGDDPLNEPLWEFVRNSGVNLFIGSEQDVLERYHACALANGFRHIVRATADNPFVDPGEGMRLLQLYGAQRLDYACAFPAAGSGHPKGVGLEVFTLEALTRSAEEGLEPHHREHVNEYILENPDRFRTGVLEATPGLTGPELDLTVDTPEDLRQADQLYRAFQATGSEGPPPAAWAVRALQKMENKR